MTNTIKGFEYEGKRIKFMDAQGKDISFPRWRISLYYAPNFALTHFANSQAEYDQFLSAHAGDCFKDYTEYRESCLKRNIFGWMQEVTA